MPKEWSLKRPHSCLQFSGHGDNVVVWRVVLVAVGANESHVVGKLQGVVVRPVVHLVSDGAEVHGGLDDFAVVVQLRQRGVHRLVERPSVGRVLLGEEFSQQGVACFQRLRQPPLCLKKN